MGVMNELARALSPSALRSAWRSPARIGQNGPIIADVMPPLAAHSSLVRFEALEPDPQKWFAAMSRADRGDTASMMDLFADARDRDSHLDGIARKRAQSLMGRPITFRPPEGFERDREALEVASSVRRILLNDARFIASAGHALGFKSALTHLMSAPGDGYAVAPMTWRTNARGEIVPLLEWAHSNRFGFDPDSWRIGFYESAYRGGKVCALSEYQDRFLVHIPMNGRSDYPWRRGAMRSCIVPSFLKRHGLRFWLVLTERFGMPQPYALVPPNLDKQIESSTADTVGKVRQALQNLSRHWSAVFTEGVKIESIPGSGNVSGEAHKELINWAETTMSIAMLGQNLSTKVDGGSFAAAEAHRYVAGDLHLSDATELAETVTQQLCEPIVRYNWPGAPVPVCEISTGYKQPFKTEHVVAGICTPDEFRRSNGHEPLPDGQGAELRAPQQVGGTPGPEPAPPGPMDQPETDDAPIQSAA